MSSIFTAFSPARALNFSFSFTAVFEPGVNEGVPGTVTGKIFGLADNTANQAASQVIIDSYPNTPPNTLTNPNEGLVATAWDTVQKNVFSVSSGQIISAAFTAASSGSELTSPLTSFLCLGSNNGSCGQNTSGALTFNFSDPQPKFTFNNDGVSGITFTNLDATPVPFSFADGSVAITFLGSFWGLNKVRQAVSKKKALLSQQSDA